MAASITRMQRELRMLEASPPPGVCAWPVEGALNHLQAQIEGPEGTVYAKGIFKLDVRIPERYPFEPPKVRFLTPVYHPNIDSGGRICLDILNMPPKGAWRPALNISTVLASLGLLLSEPNADDGLMADITEQYKHDRAVFDATARRYTQDYATGGASASETHVPALGSPESTATEKVATPPAHKENVMPSNISNASEPRPPLSPSLERMGPNSPRHRMAPQALAAQAVPETELTEQTLRQNEERGAAGTPADRQERTDSQAAFAASASGQRESPGKRHFSFGRKIDGNIMSPEDAKNGN
ncbi:hypothetical protein CYMTET_33064, partial [Cymbomonas tetramitiformis]